jgi:hypothetical protein
MVQLTHLHDKWPANRSWSQQKTARKGVLYLAHSKVVKMVVEKKSAVA